MHHLVLDADDRVAGERFFSGSHAIDNDAGGKQIRTRIDWHSNELFRRHECRRSEELASCRQLRLDQLRHAEIGDFDPAVIGNKDLAGLISR